MLALQNKEETQPDSQTRKIAANAPIIKVSMKANGDQQSVQATPHDQRNVT